MRTSKPAITTEPSITIAPLLVSCAHFCAISLSPVSLPGCVELAPNVAAFYGNLAAACLMLKRFSKGLQASKRAIELDPSFTKVRCPLLLRVVAALKYRADRRIYEPAFV
jgi:hypothetical protein